MFVNIDIIDRSFDTRMTSGIGNLAFILSVFILKILIIYTHIVFIGPCIVVIVEE